MKETYTVKIEETEAYETGFQHGLKEGVDMNPFKKDFERYCYRIGYDAGIFEYCMQEHPEE